MDKYKQQISLIILKYIVTKQLDEEEYNLSKSCRILILYMSNCCEYSFTEFMLKYYENNIVSNNPGIKYSALNVFRAIIETNKKEKIFPKIENSLEMLTSILLGNKILPIRKLVASIMKHICEKYGFSIIKN